MNSKLFVSCIALAVTAAGCHRATFYRDPSAVKGELHERWTDFFIFGLVGTETFDVRSFCPSGQAAQIQTGSNVATAIVGALTLGIYAPRKVYVTCAAGAAAGRDLRTISLEIEADRAGRAVRVRRGDGHQLVQVTLAAAGENVWQASQQAREER